MKKFLPLTFIVFTMSLYGSLLFAQNNLVVRPYGKIGILVTPPNTADLGYSLDGVPGGLDDAQNVDVTQFAV